MRAEIEHIILMKLEGKFTDIYIYVFKEYALAREFSEEAYELAINYRLSDIRVWAESLLLLSSNFLIENFDEENFYRSIGMQKNYLILVFSFPYILYSMNM